MPENDFEKQVQQKMEELKMVPSEGMWQKVQAQIPAEKKKRRFIWLPFIFLMGFLLIAYFFSGVKETFFADKNNQSKNNQASVAKPQRLEQNTPVINDQNPAIANKKISETTELNDKKNDETLIEKLTSTNKKNAFGEKNTSIIIHKKQVAANKISVEKSNKNKLAGFSEAVTGSNSIGVNKKYTTDKKRLLTRAKKTVAITKGTIEEQTEAVENYPAENKQEIANVAKDKIVPVNAANIDSINKKEMKQSEKRVVLEEDKKEKIKDADKTVKKSKWNFNVSASAGLSAAANSFLGKQVRQNSQAYLATDMTNIPTGTTGNGAYQGNNYPLPNIRQGFAFNIGIAAARKISARSDLSAGINYKFLSTSIAVESFNNYTQYHNQYHFIEIPVSFQYRIGREKTHAIYGDAGIVFSQLLSVNALQFNSVNGSYYTMNKLFNKTSIGLSAGMAINLIKNKNAPLLLGTVIYYSLTPVASTGLYAGSHYSFAGLRLQKCLKRK